MHKTSAQEDLKDQCELKWCVAKVKKKKKKRLCVNYCMSNVNVLLWDLYDC